jgi:hypothetical protein
MSGIEVNVLRDAARQPPLPFPGGNMTDKKKNPVRIVLTDEQRKQVETETGRDASAIEFTAEALEDRIAPVRFLD